MKNLIYLLLFATQFSFAQIVNNNQLDLKKIEAQILKASKTSQNTNLFKNFIADYKAGTNVSSRDLIFDYVGIGIAFNAKNNSTKLLPAKYTLNLKTRLSGIGVVGLEKDVLSEKQSKFLSIYSKNPLAIAGDDYYMEFKYHTFTNEGRLEYKNSAILTDQTHTSYFAKKDNWLYVIGISNTTNDFILYKFDTKAMPKDDYMLIQMEKDRQVKWAKESKLRAVFPMYHDIRIDEIRVALAYLLREEPYKNDKILVECAGKMTRKLDRENIRNFTAELDYFLDLKIDEKFWKYRSDEVLNLKHTSAHALADINFGNGDYKLAEKFFLRSILDFRVYSAGGSNIQKDANRIAYDLSKVYEKQGKTDETIGYLIPLLNGNGSIDLATTLLNNCITKNKIDKKSLKKQIDASFESLENLRGDGTYTYIFNGKVIFFYSVFNKTKSSFAKEVMETDFYKSL